MTKNLESNVLKKGRLTLTGNKIPDKIYKKLEKLGSDRKLTPYVVYLVEKEEMMDKLIESLSTLIHKVDHLDERFSGLEKRLSGVNVPIENKTTTDDDEIKQGDLEIGENIIGGIEEDIEEIDF
ncbi:hypothetical protein B4102_2144 [Heyndrickxia sporothermodurans]|uniref:Uncharacterized protein n=1 Tax=Heyndrickxia sporothermodurans TaxID=46224 RepID=A0A150LHJ8_9BACI|nr:hypothetical protein [Heyndrickxia sporothermodurans]KYD11416.1 hypothetical protein B4102_2144 [Heyndrickxia sporothermodurans]